MLAIHDEVVRVLEQACEAMKLFRIAIVVLAIALIMAFAAVTVGYLR
jgi:hypothetical protein